MMDNKETEGIQQKSGKKNIFFMGLTSFFMDVSSEMIFPVLPLFLANVLGINMAVIGIIEGIAEGTGSILKTFSGWLSDKIKKRKLLIGLGYSFSAITKPFLALVTAWPHVLLVRFLDRVGKGVRTSPRDALIAESSEASQRGKSFGIHRMMDTVGAIVGTIIAFWLLSKLPEAYRTIFSYSAIPAGLAVLTIIFFVKEKKKKEGEQKITPFKLSFKLFDKNFKKFVIIASLFSLANFSYAFFILRAQDLGIAIAIIPLVYLVYNIVYAIFAIPAGKFSDKVGKKTILITGYIIFGLTCLGFAFATQSIYAWILFAFYGLFFALTEGVSRAYVSDLVSPEARGTALGIYHTSIGLMAIPASIIAGFLWNFISFKATFLFSCVVAILAATLLLSLKTYRVKETSGL